MGKKPADKKDKKPAPRKSSGALWLIVAGIAAVLVVGVLWYNHHETPKTAADRFTGDGPVKLIATLDPINYTGKARAAYQAAKEIPEILAQLPCFCGCMDNMGHHNNLYCFADTHGSICDVCQSIALEAQEMHKKGMPVSQIRDNIRAAYNSGKL